MSGMIGQQDGPLRRLIDATATETGLSMAALTVLSPAADPFRLDTPKNHILGGWLIDSLTALELHGAARHLRGMHYALIGHPKPDGRPYSNTDADWEWLGTVLKAARWLGYVAFDQVLDNRNAAPDVREPQRTDQGWSYVSGEVHVEVDADIHPRVGLADFTAAQPYRLAMIAEKASAEPVLGPIADRYGADLYLPTGCMSDTMVFQLARAGGDDGRPLRVFYFADCDPSGWNMPVEVGRKLQAFRALNFPDLEFEVHRVALTPGQVAEHDLPSTPLKVTERRGDRWRQAMGIEQTELDALATLRPEVLRAIAIAAVGAFYDDSLPARAEDEKRRWIAEAQAVVDAAAGTPEMDAVRAESEIKLRELTEQIDAINDALRVDADAFDLPVLPDPPAPTLDGDRPQGMVSSTAPFADQTLGLIADRQYRGRAS